MNRWITTQAACWLTIAACTLAPAYLVSPSEAQNTPPEQAPEQPPADEHESAPAPEPVGSGLIVRDMVVLQIDKFNNQINAVNDFDSTLFNHAYRLRPAAKNDRGRSPMPLGMITFDGELRWQTNMQIAISASTGKFLGHWPKTNTAAERQLRWFNIQPAQPEAYRYPIHEKHWLRPLRDTDQRLLVTSRDNTDRFFTYDASFRYTVPFAVTGGNGTYQITAPPNSASPLVMLIQKRGTQWASAVVDSVDTDQDPHAIDLTQAELTDARQALAPLEAILREHGYTPTEISVLFDSIGPAAFENNPMSLLYVMSDEELHAVLPLTIVPIPSQTHRVGVVIVNNIDPDILWTINQLIDQLGSDDWSMRVQAQDSLIAMRRAAIETIREHANHSDPEIAHRIEQVIAAYETRRR